MQYGKRGAVCKLHWNYDVLEFYVAVAVFILASVVADFTLSVH